MTKKKILAIIYRRRSDSLEFLTLRNNPTDPVHGGDFYYVVTGGVENGEKFLDTVKREIKEETGITNIVQIKETNKIYTYTHPGEGKALCKEECFLVEVKGDINHLSDEHIGYKWLKEKAFINSIYWYYDKADLRELLKLILSQ